MTMTDERLAELDAVMAKATLGHWHVFQCVQLEGDTLFQLEARVEPDTLQCVSTDIAGEDDAAAIVALHNAYADLRAHIDAQDATIAALQAFKDYVHERLDAAGIPTHPEGKHSAAGCRVGDRLDIALDAQAATIARLTGAAKSLLALCEQAGLADDLLAAVFPDSKNRSGQTRDETAKQARRTMNEARAALGAASLRAIAGSLPND